MTEVDHVGGLDQGATDVTTSANAPAVSNDKSKPPYIVIVEDYEPLSKALCEMFRRRGNRCFAIRSKTSAEQFLRQVRPDLVVLDYQLVGGVGLAAAQIASENNVLVIMTSRHHDIFERVRKFRLSLSGQTVRALRIATLGVAGAWHRFRLDW